MALACLLARAAGAPNFSLPGPCSASPWKPQFTVPDDLRTGGLPRTLSLLVTSPSCPADASLPFGSPAPVLFFFNGFMVRCEQAAWPLRSAGPFRRRRPPLHYRPSLLPRCCARLNTAAPPCRRTRHLGTSASCSRSPAGAGWWCRCAPLRRVQACAAWAGSTSVSHSNATLRHMQYDTPSLPPVTIAAEVQLFPALAEVRPLLLAAMYCSVSSDAAQLLTRLLLQYH